MAVVVVTRLKPCTLRVLPRFLWGSIVAARQAERTSGFLGGRMRAEVRGVFWTVTIWNSGQDMAGFRDSGVHAVLVPKLAGWAAEAAFAVWTTDDIAIPSWTEVSDRLAERPNFGSLDHPGVRHRNGQVDPAASHAFVLPLRARRVRKNRTAMPHPT